MDNLDASINKGAVIVIVEHVSKRGQSDPLKLGSSFRKGEVVIHHLFDRKYFKPLSIIQKLGLLLLTFWGVKGAEVPLREVGDEYPPYRNLFILKKR